MKDELIFDSTQIGVWIRERRRDSGLTLEQAAALSGVGVRFLSELERGKESAELGKVLRVVRNLGLELRISRREADGHSGAES